MNTCIYRTILTLVYTLRLHTFIVWLIQELVFTLVKMNACFKVYKQKLFGKKYVWILTDSLYASWISKLKEGETSCSVENIKTAAHGHFTLGQKQLRTDQVVTISGRVRVAVVISYFFNNRVNLTVVWNTECKDEKALHYNHHRV